MHSSLLHGLSQQLSLEHVASLDNNADASKKILTAFPSDDWKRLPGRTPLDHMDEDSPK